MVQFGCKDNCTGRIFFLVAKLTLLLSFHIKNHPLGLRVVFVIEAVILARHSDVLESKVNDGWSSASQFDQFLNQAMGSYVHRLQVGESEIERARSLVLLNCMD